MVLVVLSLVKDIGGREWVGGRAPEPTAQPIDDTLYAVTWGPSGSNSQYPEFWVSYDGGVNWSLVDTVDTIPGGDSYASLVSDSVGNAYVVLWTTNRYPRVYYSPDQGNTWTLKGEITAAGLGAGEPSVAIQMDWQYLYVATWDEGTTPKTPQPTAGSPGPTFPTSPI